MAMVCPPTSGCAERIARMMDSQFRLPGTRFRFGLDPLLGLVPIVGDLSTTANQDPLHLTLGLYT